MPKIKRANHHWWPQNISKRWADNHGIVHQLSCEGKTVAQSNTKKFGGHENAHSIIFSNDDKLEHFNESFEPLFDNVDRNFPQTINWLNHLKSKSYEPKSRNEERFSAQFIDEQRFNTVLESILSLVVRSPRFRYLISPQDAADEGIRLTRNQKNLVPNLNLRDAFDRFKPNGHSLGKFAVLFSKNAEFIFGDGFYHNYSSTLIEPLEPRILVPLLPNMCVFYSRPREYRTEPRLVTIELNNKEVESINKTTMVYSKDFVFYRSQKPLVTAEFSCCQFLEHSQDYMKDFHQNFIAYQP